MRIYYWVLIASSLVTACTKAPSPAQAPDLLRPATIKDIMDSMVNPSGDFVFESVQQISDEHGITRKSADRPMPNGRRVRRHLFVLLEAPNLLVMEGRKVARPEDRSRNPEVENEPEAVQQVGGRPTARAFIRRARRLQDAAALAMKAVDAKDKDALFHAIDGYRQSLRELPFALLVPERQKGSGSGEARGDHGIRSLRFLSLILRGPSGPARSPAAYKLSRPFAADLDESAGRSRHPRRCRRRRVSSCRDLQRRR